MSKTYVAAGHAALQIRTTAAQNLANSLQFQLQAVTPLFDVKKMLVEYIVWF